jgi:hypothetical protein
VAVGLLHYSDLVLVPGIHFTHSRAYSDTVPTGSIQFQSVLGNAGAMGREPALALKNTGLGPLAIIADPKFRSYYEIP